MSPQLLQGCQRACVYLHVCHSLIQVCPYNVHTNAVSPWLHCLHVYLTQHNIGFFLTPFNVYCELIKQNTSECKPSYSISPKRKRKTEACIPRYLILNNPINAPTLSVTYLVALPDGLMGPTAYMPSILDCMSAYYQCLL